MRNQDLDAACAAVRAMGQWGEVVGWELARKWLLEHQFDSAAHELPAAGDPHATGHTPWLAHHMAHAAIHGIGGLGGLVARDVRADLPAAYQGLLPICRQALTCQAIVTPADDIITSEATNLAGMWPRLAWMGGDDDDPDE